MAAVVVAQPHTMAAVVVARTMAAVVVARTMAAVGVARTMAAVVVAQTMAAVVVARTMAAVVAAQPHTMEACPTNDAAGFASTPKRHRPIDFSDHVAAVAPWPGCTASA
jgi:hypothetical protein